MDPYRDPMGTESRIAPRLEEISISIYLYIYIYIMTSKCIYIYKRSIVTGVNDHIKQQR